MLYFCVMAISPTPQDELWPALRKQLLLGTNQQSLTETLTEALVIYHISEDEEAPLLLEAVGTLHLLQKGARKLSPYEGALPTAVPPSDRSPCSWRSVQHLQAILQGHHAAALPEFARLLARHNKALPAASLPELFDQCTQESQMWSLLQPLIDERGYWLLRQHPEWSKLVPDISLLEDWMNAKGKEQVLLLHQWRAVDAAAARVSLESQWPNLDHKAKAKFLPSLQTGLSLEDEAFLTIALEENRKGVRLAAADLLTQLPDSQLVQQLSVIAADALVLKNDKLVLNLPDDVPKHTQALGIYPTGSKQAGGLKLNWLVQILERVPFTYWEKRWNKAAAQLIPLFAQATYGLVLLQAITASLNRFPHPEAQTALIRWWLLSGQETQWNKAAAKQLLLSASDDQFNEILLFWLQQAGPLVPADSLAAYWLSQGKHRWSASLSKLIVFGFRDVIQNLRVADWSVYHYKQILEAAAYQSDAHLLEVFKNGWSFRSAGFGRWHADVEQLLQTLHFRLEMNKALEV
jgi:hypothetical protein